MTYIMDILFLRSAINLGCIVYFETKSQPIKVHLVYHLIFIIYTVVLITRRNVGSAQHILYVIREILLITLVMRRLSMAMLYYD
jgi:hypothetical protein